MLKMSTVHHPSAKVQKHFKAIADWIETQVAPRLSVPHSYRLTEWRKELVHIKDLIERPQSARIALIGTTGAGKSTFLNAVIGQQVLPVGVMQPCTAFVTLVRQSSQPGYTLDVDFCSLEEWTQEVESFAALLNPGDEEANGTDIGESKRLIEASRKRLQAVLGELVNSATRVEDLMNIALPAEAVQVLSGHGKTSLQFESAQEMLVHLKRLIRGESQLWPLVKQVTVAGPYDCLAGGLEIVDLPGLNDPNAARVEVTRDYLRSSPFVWVMFPMVRGLTNDVQVLLREEKLLRTVVLAGSYNALTLIGTKADDVDHNITDQLGLPEDVETEALIREYCRQTEASARNQLVEMVQDMIPAAEGGETLTNMLDLARRLKVHTTSANAYMKLQGIGGLRKDYGLTRLDDTGIPAVHRYLREIAREAGTDFHMGMAAKRLDQLRNEIAFFFRAASHAESPDAHKARERIQAELARTQAELNAARTRAEDQLRLYREQFVRGIAPMLRDSIQGVHRACQSWGGIAWPTVRAIVQRDGEFKSPTTGKYYNFNDNVTEPLLERLPLSWQRFFTDDLGRVSDVYATAITGIGVNFCEKVRLIVEITFKRRDDTLNQQLAWFDSKVKLLTQTAQSKILVEVASRRSELAAKIPDVSRHYMLPAYASAKTESGPGMKARMLQRVTEQAVRSAPAIFDTIQTDLLEGLASMDAVLVAVFMDLSNQAIRQGKTVADNAAIDIDDEVLSAPIKELLSSQPCAYREMVMAA